MRCVRFSTVAALFLFAGAAQADTVTGDWVTQGFNARVRIQSCETAVDRWCGTITWLWESVDREGVPLRDRNNPDPSLRSRPLIGLAILKDFRISKSNEWTGGTIYDPESGRAYQSTLTLRAGDVLEVSGCVLFLCRSQIWRRAETVCREQ